VVSCLQRVITDAIRFCPLILTLPPKVRREPALLAEQDLPLPALQPRGPLGGAAGRAGQMAAGEDDSLAASSAAAAAAARADALSPAPKTHLDYWNMKVKIAVPACVNSPAVLALSLMPLPADHRRYAGRDQRGQRHHRRAGASWELRALRALAREGLRLRLLITEILFQIFIATFQSCAEKHGGSGCSRASSA